MRYIVGRDNIKLKNTVVTLGKFDGIHLGHQLLIKESIRGKQQGFTSVLFTFEQSLDNKYIYDEKEKKELLEETGIDVCIVYPFDNKTKNMDPVDFIKHILIDTLDMKKIVIGQDFRFGKDRAGNIDLLKQMSQEFEYEVVVFNKKVADDGEEISSRKIREDIINSKMDKVTRNLGRTYSFSGIISKGKQLGRTIGYPTINIKPGQQKMMPRNGVYASRIIFNDEQNREYVGMTNIGNNPTVNDSSDKTIETNIFDFEGNVYNKNVKIYIEKYIRDEKKFSSIEELKQQINKDKVAIING